MSKKLQALIQDIKGLPGRYKRILLAWASFANNDGTNIFPAKETVGARAGVSRWTVYENSDILEDAGVLQRASNHVCRTENCHKGGTHWTSQHGQYTAVYKINVALLGNPTVLLQKIKEATVAKSNSGTVGKTQLGTVGKPDTTQASIETPAPLGIFDSSALASESKKETKEASLASLATTVVEVKIVKLQSSSPESQEPTKREEEPILVHPSVYSLMRMWKDRTGYVFTAEEMFAANQLIIAYRYRVVEAVLRNTLWERPRSAKLRWNKFTVFARNWKRNHEEYLAWKAVNEGHSAVEKFDQVPDDDRIDAKEWNSLAAWLREYGKFGEWDIISDEWKALGFRRGHVYVVLRYLADEDCITVTKEKFIDLLFEAAGAKAVGAAVGGFDVEEA